MNIIKINLENLNDFGKATVFFHENWSASIILGNYNVMKRIKKCQENVVKFLILTPNPCPFEHQLILAL